MQTNRIQIRYVHCLKSIVVFLLFFFGTSLAAQTVLHCDYEIDASTSSITNSIFNPGDTVCILPGLRGPLYLKNMHGTEENPIVIINKNGQSIIESDLSYGIKFAECEHIILSGNGDIATKYGIQINSVPNGYGLNIGGLSTDFEVEYLEIGNVGITGIVAKTDPNCVYDADRDHFTMYNVSIHDNYIHHCSDEGMYIGSSFFLGQYISACDKTFLPHIIDGVEIYNNRVEYTGWDGIQVGSALNACNVHDNYIYKDSQAEETYQMSGIIINTGSSCNVYNNQIIDGKGTGILIQGTGGQKYFNNLIVNAGQDYYPEDQTLKQQFGIFCKYTYIQKPDSSFQFYNNTIINPKSDGIRFMNSHSENNRFINNIIINPGAYDYYDNLGSVNYQASDAYIHNYLDAAEVSLSNNIFERSSKSQFFADTINYDYHLSKDSPAVNSGYDLSTSGITFDIENYNRPFESYFDIGAYEYQLLTSISRLSNPDQQIFLSPNPTSDFLNIKLQVESNQVFSLIITSIDGKLYHDFSDIRFLKGENVKQISVKQLPNGEYMLLLYNKSSHLSKAFIKQ